MVGTFIILAIVLLVVIGLIICAYKHTSDEDDFVGIAFIIIFFYGVFAAILVNCNAPEDKQFTVKQVYPVESFINTSKTTGDFTLFLGCGGGESSNELYYIFNRVTKNNVVITERLNIDDCSLVVKDSVEPSYIITHSYNISSICHDTTETGVSRCLILPRKYIKRNIDYNISNYK